MVAGIGSWDLGSYFSGPWGKSFTAAVSAVLVFDRLFPRVGYTPNDSHFSWAASNGLLSDRQITFMNNIDRQVFGEAVEMEMLDHFRSDPESGAEQKPEAEQTEPRPIPYGDHSLWDLAGKTFSSWLRGLCINGINLDPKTVRTVADAATVAGGFGAMLFVFYLAKREPKTDYYYCSRVAVPPPSEASQKPRSNRLLELEAALLKLKSASLKEPT